MEATIESLCDRGYSATTTHIVADLAGMSRGAMLHHFQTKTALMAATVEFAYERQSAFREAQLSKLESGLDRYRALIDLAWATAQMPEGVAVNEVRIGSRSDPDLADAVTPIAMYISAQYGRFVGRIVREAGLEPDEAVRGLTATWAMALRALAIDRATHPDELTVSLVLNTLKRQQEAIIRQQLGEKA